MFCRCVIDDYCYFIEFMVISFLLIAISLTIIYAHWFSWCFDWCVLFVRWFVSIFHWYSLFLVDSAVFSLMHCWFFIDFYYRPSDFYLFLLQKDAPPSSPGVRQAFVRLLEPFLGDLAPSGHCWISTSIVFNWFSSFSVTVHRFWLAYLWFLPMCS